LGRGRTQYFEGRGALNRSGETKIPCYDMMLTAVTSKSDVVIIDKAK
jgi:hypothetical protein